MPPLKYYLIFLFLFIHFSSFTQSEALEAQLEIAKNPQEKFSILKQFIDYYEKRDIKKAIPYAKKAVALATDLNQNEILAESQFLLGKTYSLTSQLDSALIYLNKAQNIYSGLNQEVEQADVLLEIAKIKINQNELKQAMEQYIEAEKIFQEADNQAGVARVQNGVADVFYAEQDWNKSIEYCKKAIAIQEQLNVPTEMAQSYVNLVYPLMIHEQLDLALEAANKAISLHHKAGSAPIETASAYNARGNVYKYMERYDDAITDYKENLRIGQETKMERAVMISYANLGHVYTLKEDFTTAIPHLMQAIQKMKERNETRNLQENYMHLTNSYAAIGNYEKALEFAWKFADEIELNYQNIVDLMKNEQVTKFEIGHQAAVIKLQEEQIQQQRNIQWLTYGILSLLAAILFLLWRNYRIKQKTNQILHVTNDKLAKKNEENELLLKEIHHRVKNNLQVISSLLSLQSADIVDATALDAVKESQNRVRSMALIHQKLYQRERLAAVEMKNYFEELGETILDSFGEYNDRIQINYPMEALELDVDTAIPIGLIVNELMTNALKYGFPNQQQGQIDISLTKNETTQQLYLTIADNGVGMTTIEEATMKSSGGFGMRLVNLLTKQLKGTLVTRPEKGTVVEIGFPLK